MVTVHHFKVWNKHKGDWEIPPSKRTADAILKFDGQIITDTAEEVEISQLDKDGRYFPYGAAVQADRPVADDKRKENQSDASRD